MQVLLSFQNYLVVQGWRTHENAKMERVIYVSLQDKSQHKTKQMFLIVMRSVINPV